MSRVGGGGQLIPLPWGLMTVETWLWCEITDLRSSGFSCCAESLVAEVASDGTTCFGATDKAGWFSWRTSGRVSSLARPAVEIFPRSYLV